MKEQNEELLQAALNLLNILNNVDDLSNDEWEVIGDARKIVAQHRSEPQRLEGWINFYNDSRPGGTIWPTEQEAKDYCLTEGARQVHIREVVPVEWEPWTVEMVRNHQNFQETVDAHNAEMERITK